MMENKIKAFLTKHDQWSKILTEIRQIISKTELEETVKWGMPVYTINNKNVVGIAGFKHHYGLWFYQGVFLKDPKKVLVNAQEGKTKGMRHLRFSDISEFDEKLVIAYVKEAIQNAKDGKEIKSEPKQIKIPNILKEAFDKDSKLKSAFAKFSPGKQKEFFEFVGSAKREATQLSRLEKSITMINKGESPNDKYRK